MSSGAAPPKKSAAARAAAAAAAAYDMRSENGGLDKIESANAAAAAAELVVSHLLRECHVGTVAALLTDGERIASHPAARARLSALRSAAGARGLVEGAAARAICRDHVRAGRIEAALLAADNLLGGCRLESRAERLYFDLCCQQYVELVRAGRVADAVTYSQTTLAPRAQRGSGLVKGMEELCALMAYPKPETCPVAYLLDERRRWALADRLSGTLFAEQFRGFAAGRPNRSALEAFVRQANLVRDTLDRFRNDANGVEKTSDTHNILDDVDDDDDDDQSSDARGSAPPRTVVEDAEVVEDDEMNDD